MRKTKTYPIKTVAKWFSLTLLKPLAALIAYKVRIHFLRELNGVSFKDNLLTAVFPVVLEEPTALSGKLLAFTH